MLLQEHDTVISDELNHVSIIDGILLCKAQRLRYRDRGIADLKIQPQNAQHARRRLIVTDGVFSMDGFFAPLGEICELADRYNALVMVDDSHAVGFLGPSGAGTPELFGVTDRVDIISGTPVPVHQRGRAYPRGIKNRQAHRTLETTGILSRHDFHDEWNYTFKRQPATHPNPTRLNARVLTPARGGVGSAVTRRRAPGLSCE